VKEKKMAYYLMEESTKTLLLILDFSFYQMRKRRG
jgi:hypothetical protein